MPPISHSCFLVSALLLAGPTGWAQRSLVFHFKSLSVKLDQTVHTGATPRRPMQHKDTSPAVAPSPLSLTLVGGEVRSKNVVVASIKTVAMTTTNVAPVYKKREITDKHNLLTLT